MSVCVWARPKWMCLNNKTFRVCLHINHIFRRRQRLIIWILFGVFIEIQCDCPNGHSYSHRRGIDIRVAGVLQKEWYLQPDGWICLFIGWNGPKAMMKPTPAPPTWWNLAREKKLSLSLFRKPFQTLSQHSSPWWWCLLNSIFYTFIHLQ